MMIKKNDIFIATTTMRRNETKRKKARASIKTVWSIYGNVLYARLACTNFSSEIQSRDSKLLLMTRKETIFARSIKIMKMTLCHFPILFQLSLQNDSKPTRKQQQYHVQATTHASRNHADGSSIGRTETK